MVEKCCKTCMYLKYGYYSAACVSPNNATKTYDMFSGTKVVPLACEAQEVVEQFCKLNWWEPSPGQQKSP